MKKEYSIGKKLEFMEFCARYKTKNVRALTEMPVYGDAIMMLNGHILSDNRTGFYTDKRGNIGFFRMLDSPVKLTSGRSFLYKSYEAEIISGEDFLHYLPNEDTDLIFFLDILVDTK